MKNKYLFSDETNKESITDYIAKYGLEEKNISFNSSTIDNTGCLIITFSTKGNALQDAISLSALDTEIVQFKPVVLENGASSYFNKSLYPLVNDFERLLREFLYILAAQKQDDKELVNRIRNLEEKTFGDIYADLFVDRDYMNQIKDVFTKGNAWKISKAEMDYKLELLEETTPWTSLVRTDELRSIQNSFFMLKEYRNHIMHAHNISYSEFLEIKKIYTKCNVILSNEIDYIYGNNEIKDVYISGLDEIIDRWLKYVMHKSSSSTKVLEELGKAMYEITKQAIIEDEINSENNENNESKK